MTIPLRLPEVDGGAMLLEGEFLPLFMGPAKQISPEGILGSGNFDIKEYLAL